MNTALPNCPTMRKPYTSFHCALQFSFLFIFSHVMFVVNKEINKNLAIANRSRVSCINTNNNTMTLKSGLEATQGH